MENIEAIATIQLDRDIDAAETLHVFKCSARELYAIFGLKAENWSKLQPKSCYRDSGYWESSRDEDGNMKVYVDVGCSCSHDCCGHLCGLSYTFSKCDGLWIVKVNRSYNY
jgi:hypothetical protein